MDKSLELYHRSPLFEGVDEAALIPLLECLRAGKRVFIRGEVLFAADEPARMVGIVVSGRVQTVYEDALGRRGVISYFEPGQLVCDAFSCTREQKPTVDIVAQTDCCVILMDTNAVLHTCSKSCAQHLLVIENLVHILAEKYVGLSRKVLHLSARTTRDKLLSYFLEQSKLAGGAPFRVPYSQQELADYLFIDRSGLSTELNKLKKEGVLLGDNGRYTLNAEACGKTH
jgi:CRP-like cAMP-binding protein